MEDLKIKNVETETEVEVELDIIDAVLEGILLNSESMDDWDFE